MEALEAGKLPMTKKLTAAVTGIWTRFVTVVSGFREKNGLDRWKKNCHVKLVLEIAHNRTLKTYHSITHACRSIEQRQFPEKLGNRKRFDSHIG